MAATKGVSDVTDFYEVRVTDFDAAPDAEALYGIAKIRRFAKLRDAEIFAEREAEIYIGAAVYLNGKERLARFGSYIEE